MITRLIAIVPALVCILWFGEEQLGDLLVLSQVVLSLQLGFAVIPLIHFTSDKQRMGEHVIKPWVRVLAWISAVIIVVLNARLVVQKIQEWLAVLGPDGIWIWCTVVPVVVAAFMLLLYIAFKPFIRRERPAKQHLHDTVPELKAPVGQRYTRICVAVDFSAVDQRSIDAAVAQGGKEAEYMLIHITESATARYMGELSEDHETQRDAENLQRYVSRLKDLGYRAWARTGQGHPVRAISAIVNTSQCDLLVMGGHGHRGIKDLLLGATVDAVRHRVKVPVLIVR